MSCHAEPAALSENFTPQSLYYYALSLHEKNAKRYTS